MKNLITVFRKTAQIILFLIFFLSLFDFVTWIFPSIDIFNSAKSKLRKEEYDPSLLRISSLEKLESYTDSICKNFQNPTLYSKAALFPEMLTEIVRKRFFHGFYAYRPGYNFIAWGATKIVRRSWNEVWGADEILKSPYSQCGQQSLVIMELLIRKGYPVRKVVMQSTKYNSGHFVLEAYYDSSWHMFDPDEEPDLVLLRKLGRPSVEQIAKDTVLIKKLYSGKSQQIIDMMNNINYGETNRLMANRGYLFQEFTRYLSRFFWVLYVVIFYLKRRFFFTKAV